MRYEVRLEGDEWVVLPNDVEEARYIDIDRVLAHARRPPLGGDAFAEALCRDMPIVSRSARAELCGGTSITLGRSFCSAS